MIACTGPEKKREGEKTEDGRERRQSMEGREAGKGGGTDGLTDGRRRGYEGRKRPIGKK